MQLETLKGERPELFEQVESLRIESARLLAPNVRALRGQFFTPEPTAELMASMFCAGMETVRLLDPGAGIGSLTAAFVEAALRWHPAPRAIHVTTIEIDPQLSPYLRETLALCKSACVATRIEFSAQIITEDFIGLGVRQLSDKLNLFDTKLPAFTHAIVNPPYLKINSGSQTRVELRRVGIETTNFYSAFLWLTLQMLAPLGQLVAITPRSFCNGPYFRRFRLALLQTVSLERIHVFDSRTKSFAEDDILQENVVFYAVKGKPQTETLTISSSADANDAVKWREVHADGVVHPSDKDGFIHLVGDEIGMQIRQRIQKLNTSLDELDIEVSTGRVVDFRAAHWLRMKPSAQTVPLIYPSDFAAGFVDWMRTNGKKPHAILRSARDLLVPSGVYVLVKRFTAKEERRRLVAAVYDPTRTRSDAVGFENHLNYFHRHGKGLPLDLAKGLTAFLNSTVLDEYFRQFSGHTQVNATDLRKLKYPIPAQLIAIGMRIGDTFPDQVTLDKFIAEEIGLMADTTTSPPDPIATKHRIREALDILKTLGLPRAQQNERSALTLLALLGLDATTPWREVTAPQLGISEMMDLFAARYGVRYAPNTRETVRRQTIHQFMQAGLVYSNLDDPERAINSPKTRYQIDPATLELIKHFGSPEWDEQVRAYLTSGERLLRLQSKERNMKIIPVRLLNGSEIILSAGGQNQLIKKIVEEFCPRYTPGGTIVYIGDAGAKMQGQELEYLRALGIRVDKHGKMPDLIVHLPDKNWLVLIEAVTSHGPVDLKRHSELKELFAGSAAGLVFVTGFETRRAMVRFLRDIAWETEVWVAESPTHLIHFNGERFLGPYR